MEELKRSVKDTNIDGADTDGANTKCVIHKKSYCNQFGIIRNIVFNYIKCINRHDKVELIIYYKTRNSASRVTRNSVSTIRWPTENQSHSWV